MLFVKKSKIDIGIKEIQSLLQYIQNLKIYYGDIFSKANSALSDKKYAIQQKDKVFYKKWRQTYYNEALAKSLKKTFSTTN